MRIMKDVSDSDLPAEWFAEKLVAVVQEGWESVYGDGPIRAELAEPEPEADDSADTDQSA